MIQSSFAEAHPATPCPPKLNALFISLINKASRQKQSSFTCSFVWLPEEKQQESFRIFQMN